MKMWLYILISVVIIAAYLYAANAYIYYRIGKASLPFPDTKQTYSFSNDGASKLYIALGDSLTAGVGVSDFEDSYTYQLAERLGKDSSLTLTSLAYPGFRSGDLIVQFLDDAVARKPDIVTVLIGTNDIHNWATAAQFEKNYRTIIEKLKAETDADIYAVSIPFIGSNALYLPPMNHFFDWRTKRLNAVIERVAEEKGITYIDIATPTRGMFKKDTEVYSMDSFHPSAAGYRLWADILYAAIDR